MSIGLDSVSNIKKDSDWDWTKKVDRDIPSLMSGDKKNNCNT